MNSVLNNAMGIFNAASHFFQAAVQLTTRNPWFLGLAILMLIGAGKSLKIGRLFSVKG